VGAVEFLRVFVQSLTPIHANNGDILETDGVWPFKGLKPLTPTLSSGEERENWPATAIKGDPMLELGTMSTSTCEGISRRGLLRIGGLSALGLSLPRLLEAEAKAAEGSRARELSCIVLWMKGGAPQQDTFDMKPRAPVEYRGEFRSISTNVPGRSVCEHLPVMSGKLDKLCQLRTIVHSGGQHAEATHFMLTGYPQIGDPTGQPVGSVVYPAMGSVIGRELGWRDGMPPYVQISGGPLKYSGGGYMGSAFNPLMVTSDPNANDFGVRDVTIPDSIGEARTRRRRRMLEAVDDWQRKVESEASIVFEKNQFYRQAYDLITSPAAKRAFKLQEEPDSIRNAYGRTKDAQAMLLARRLVQAGVRLVCVNVSGSGGWDTHADNFKRLKNDLLPNVDRPWAALLDDLESQGMFENTLVIWMGEFGRTPKVNGQAGRDHYPKVNNICFSGNMVRMGEIVGRTDDLAANVVGTQHSTADFAATIYSLFGINPAKQYHGSDGRPHLLTDNGKPIREVLA